MQKESHALKSHAILRKSRKKNYNKTKYNQAFSQEIRSNNLKSFPIAIILFPFQQESHSKVILTDIMVLHGLSRGLLHRVYTGHDRRHTACFNGIAASRRIQCGQN